MGKTLNSHHEPLEMEILSLISNTKEGMFANNESGRILVWNRTAEAILGFSAMKSWGKPVTTLFQEENFQAFPFVSRAAPWWRWSNHITR